MTKYQPFVHVHSLSKDVGFSCFASLMNIFFLSFFSFPPTLVSLFPFFLAFFSFGLLILFYPFLSNRFMFFFILFSLTLSSSSYFYL